MRIRVLRKLIVLSSLFFMFAGCSSLRPWAIKGEVNMLVRQGFREKKTAEADVVACVNQYIESKTEQSWLSGAERIYLFHEDKGWVVYIYRTENADDVVFVKLQIANGAIYLEVDGSCRRETNEE